MKKHILSLAAAAAFTLTLCSCSENNGGQPTSDGAESSISADASAPAEAIQPFIDYFNGFIGNESEKVILSTTPQTFIDEMKKTDKYEDMLTKYQENLIPVTTKSWNEKYGSDISVTFIEQVNSSQLAEDQLELAELCYKYTYFDVNADVEIAEGYEVTYKYEIKGSSGSTEGNETACFVRVENDGWKMISVTAETLEQYRGAADPYEETQA